MPVIPSALRRDGERSRSSIPGTVVRVVAAITFASLAAAAGLQGADTYNDFPVLRGPWLGQPPPGDAAEVFAPGVLKPSTGYHSSVVFHPDGDEACWTA